MRGTVFDIKRFAVHDGPGIRTTVFLKGCPLACPWCQNPEGIAPEIGIWYTEGRCIRCHRCIEVCPEDALSAGEAEGEPAVRIHRERCTVCGACVRECPSAALEFDAREMGAAEVVEEVLKDRVFYETSGGGVTLSGGDPLFQAAFSREVLGLCREEGLHTAIETCLFAAPETVEPLVDLVDLFLVDLKLTDSARHEELTGRPSDPIRANFEALCRRGTNVRVRVPLIPAVTATEENVRAVARYVREVDERVPVELINFNPLARSKYRRLGRAYAYGAYEAPLPDEEVERLAAAAAAEGVRCLSE